MPIKGPTFCIVTGASRGIGKALSLAISDLLPAGSLIVLIARNGELLRAVQSEILDRTHGTVAVSVVECDLQKPNCENFAQFLLDSLENCTQDQLLGCGLLLQNAATNADISKRARELTDLEAIRTYFDMNFHSFVLLNNCFLEICRRKKIEQLTLIDINSSYAFRGLPCNHLYGSAKAARFSFYSNLAAEEPNLRIFSYSPGPILTDMQIEYGEKAWSEEVRKSVQEEISSGEASGPEVAAKELLQIIEKDQFQSGTMVDRRGRTLRYFME